VSEGASLRGAGWPTAATAVAGVIGSPVRHSLSPLLHNAAFRACGLDWAYLAFEVPAGSAGRAIAGARALGVRGLSVTMPHKQPAAEAADRVSSVVRRLGAANTLLFDEDGVRAESTDGEGLVAAVRERGFEPSGARCGVLGAGGAARAVVLALATAGAAEVAVWARRKDRAEAATALAASGQGRTVDVTSELAGADLLVNATPLGMQDHDGPQLFTEAGSFHAGQMVVDLVYDPVETPLLELAARGGASVMNGLPVLVHQAARQFELWTGEPAPLRAMWEAVGGS
jgi:shikimate dehydrogenase